jgi:hypothetical protein
MQPTPQLAPIEQKHTMSESSTNHDRAPKRRRGENVPKPPDLTGEIITVRVGTQEKGGISVFSVHQNVLSSSSPFFQAANKPEWFNGDGIDLPEDDPEIFKMYLGYLYTGTCYVDERYCVFYHTLAQAYVFGEKILDTEFQDSIMGLLLSRCGYVNPLIPGKETIALIYDKTPHGSPARRFIVDLCTWSVPEDWDGLGTLAEDVGDEFVTDLLSSVLRHREMPGPYGPSPWLRPKSYLHSDGDDTAAEDSEYDDYSMMDDDAQSSHDNDGAFGGESGRLCWDYRSPQQHDSRGVWANGQRPRFYSLVGHVVDVSRTRVV